MRNSAQGKTSMAYLEKVLGIHDCLLVGLNLKYNFLQFGHVLSLSMGIAATTNLVKLDLSCNGLKSCVAKYVMDALKTNRSITDINLGGNLLDNEFAVDLAHVLQDNPVLVVADINTNPINTEGAKYILQVLLQYNDTLSSLGDLSKSMHMGVRVREEIAQAL